MSSNKHNNPALKLRLMRQPVVVPGRLHSLPRLLMHSEITRKVNGKDRRTMRLGGPNQVCFHLQSYDPSESNDFFLVWRRYNKSAGFSGEYTIWRHCIKSVEHFKSECMINGAERWRRISRRADISIHLPCLRSLMT